MLSKQVVGRHRGWGASISEVLDGVNRIINSNKKEDYVSKLDKSISEYDRARTQNRRGTPVLCLQHSGSESGGFVIFSCFFVFVTMCVALTPTPDLEGARASDKVAVTFIGERLSTTKSSVTWWPPCLSE